MELMTILQKMVKEAMRPTLMQYIGKPWKPKRFPKVHPEPDLRTLKDEDARILIAEMQKRLAAKMPEDLPTSLTDPPTSLNIPTSPPIKVQPVKEESNSWLSSAFKPATPEQIARLNAARQLGISMVRQLLPEEAFPKLRAVTEAIRMATETAAQKAPVIARGLSDFSGLSKLLSMTNKR